MGLKKDSRKAEDAAALTSHLLKNRGQPMKTEAGAPDQAEMTAMVESAVLAPSIHNSQPWKYVLTEGRIDVYADLSRKRPVTDPKLRALYISVGCAITNLEVSAARIGSSVVEQLFPDPAKEDLVARIGLDKSGESNPTLSVYHMAVPQRRTQRKRFQRVSIPAESLECLTEVFTEPDVSVVIITDREVREQVGALVAAADKQLYSNPAFREELADWTREDPNKRDDVIPSYLLGFPATASVIGPMLVQ